MPSVGPERWNATRVPSGDQAGAVSLVAGSLLRLAVRPEAGLTMKTSSQGAGAGGAHERDPAVLAGHRRPGGVVGAGDGDEETGEQGEQGEPLGHGERLP